MYVTRRIASCLTVKEEEEEEEDGDGSRERGVE